jgi:glycosyltransferase involved in cell wall biosynthesis
MPAIYRNRLFVAVSSSTTEALRAIGVAEENIKVIESGVDLPSGPVPKKTAEPLFVSLSRLVPRKRIDLMLETWGIASRQIPGRLVIAGDGPELDKLRQQATSIPRADAVGRVSDDVKRDLLGQVRAVVSAAHHEGWGMSIMEAAVSGTVDRAMQW